MPDLFYRETFMRISKDRIEYQGDECRDHEHACSVINQCLSGEFSLEKIYSIEDVQKLLSVLESKHWEIGSPVRLSPEDGLFAYRTIPSCGTFANGMNWFFFWEAAPSGGAELVFIAGRSADTGIVMPRNPAVLYDW